MGSAEQVPGAVPNLNKTLPRHERRVWETVFRSPLMSFWDLKDIPYNRVVKRVWRGLFEDRVFGWAAELGFYFLFALFPTLICASSILGLVARSAHQFYGQLLGHLAIVIPTSAMGAVLKTFNETTAAATSGKVTFGLIAAIWSASVGVSAIQETLNAVYKIEDRRSYIIARLQAIGLTILLIVMVSAGLGSMLAGDYFANLIGVQVHDTILRVAGIAALRLVSWIVAGVLLALTFAVLYYWAPDCDMRWHWITPGAVIGIVGWMLASLGFRLYLHYFNTYSLTYGSLGAVVILLMWFYITGLMLLFGAEVNSKIEAAAAERSLELHDSGSVGVHAQAVSASRS
ncbi:MAG TPA: YihY/virulence factor BrkB family protein [Terracidiphilus sp.]|jgi:membrane protein|nr:YihY/virulence factor BrkB family protein [Terracidiphilus sp.]